MARARLAPGSRRCAMSRTTAGRTVQTAVELARASADCYVAALTENLPMDNAPGDVNLIRLATHIQRAVQDEQREVGDASDSQDSALRAGYLLGVQIGLR